MAGFVITVNSKNTVNHQHKKQGEKDVSNMKDYYQDFLDNGGSNLGYHLGFLPELDDIKHILINEIDAQVYSELKEECE